MPETKLTPRKEKALQTRDRIYNAAVTLFDKRGYDNVTIDDICNAVGMSKGAFYVHFKSKDQVLIEEFFNIDRHYQELSDKIFRMENDIERLRSFWRSSLEYIDKMGVKAVKVVFHTEIGPSRKTPYIASRRRPVFKIVEKLISEGQEAGYVRDDINPRELSDIAITCWRGLVYEWCLTNGKFDLQDRGQKILRVILSGLETTPR